MRKIAIILSILILFAGIVLAAYNDFTLKLQRNSTIILYEENAVLNPLKNFSIKQIDSLSAAVDYSFTIKNSVIKNSDRK